MGNAFEPKGAGPAYRRLMRPQQIPLDERLLDYVVRWSDPLPEAVSMAMRRADELERSGMQLSADQALLVRFLLRLIGARRVLEIGTFLGFSALVMADAVGPEGQIVCLDQNAEWTQAAQEMWRQAGVSDRIELVLGDAHETIRNLEGEFDAVLIDADKGGYLDYLEQVTPRLRSNGLLMVDNTLWSGEVVDEGEPGSDTEALRYFNRVLAEHPDYDVVIVAVGDGLTLARKT